MRIASLGIALALIAAWSMLAPASIVRADSGSRSYQFLVGSGLLCELAPNACPDITMAPNGDTVALSGGGTFSLPPFTPARSGRVVPKAASGGGRGAGKKIE